jgi:hypothetical protein
LLPGRSRVLLGEAPARRAPGPPQTARPPHPPRLAPARYWDRRLALALGGPSGAQTIGSFLLSPEQYSRSLPAGQAAQWDGGRQLFAFIERCLSNKHPRALSGDCPGSTAPPDPRSVDFVGHAACARGSIPSCCSSQVDAWSQTALEVAQAARPPQSSVLELGIS